MLNQGWKCAPPTHLRSWVWSVEVSVVVMRVVAEPLGGDLHVLIAEGETVLEGLEDVEVFLSEQVCI
jgi:hypothetical protein